jgi:uncharacterized protein (TIGR02996 family)
MLDDPFVRALRERPDDDDARRVYADWLDDQADADSAGRAAFLRTEIELAALPAHDERRADLQERLRQLAADIEPAWLAIVSKPRLEKCLFALELECPQQWERLTPTAARSVRFCASCGQNVYYCTTLREAARHAACGHCVAVDARVLRRDDDLGIRSIGIAVGRPSPPPRPAWDTPEADEAGRPSSTGGLL